MTRPNTVADVWARVAVGAPDECWLWQGGTTLNGYGVFYLAGSKTVAHRAAYRDAVGPIPDGFQLDHLCRARLCCNPAHLEPVTALENTRRSPLHNGAKTTCAQGHPYSPENTLSRKTRLGGAGRACRTCHNANTRERRARLRAQQTPSTT